MSECTLCPRDCRADRVNKLGYCGSPRDIYVSRIILHSWEEPCISGSRGSGAVFFCGCPLKCSFCQNSDISRGDGHGNFAGMRRFSEDEFTASLLKLQADGAHNVNFVSPTQYADSLIRVVADARRRGLTLPVVWNTGGYEKAETVEMLRGTVDVFLTDMKYFSRELSHALSGAADYFDRAASALRVMCDIAGEPFIEDGIMRRGVIVRHLVLPGCRKDSADLLRYLADNGFEKKVLLSLMSQYTPDFFTGCADGKLSRSLKRRVTTFEYSSVMSLASDLGFTGFGQERESAQKKYTPDWGFEKGSY